MDNSGAIYADPTGETPWTDEAAATLASADQLQADGKWQPAMDLYREALSLSPNPPAFQRYVLHNNIGWSLFHLNDWTSAEENYRMALRATPNVPPTDHAYINLATLYKAQGKMKSTIKAYRSAVQLTKQLPTWAQLGAALMHEFRVDEAVSTLQEGLAFRGDSDPGAQECHWYLGKLNMWRRRWSTASNHFIKSLDLGLPDDASGCRGGRWSVTEGWTNTASVTVHSLPLRSITDATKLLSLRTNILLPAEPLYDLQARTASFNAVSSNRDEEAIVEKSEQRSVVDELLAAGVAPNDARVARARLTDEMETLATAEFRDEITGEVYSEAPPAVTAADAAAAAALREQGKDDTPPSPYKLVEIKNVFLEGPKHTSLFHGAPECRYYVGEHTASGIHSVDFGVVDREQNATYDRATRYEVKTRVFSWPTFAVFDVRGHEYDTYNAQVSLLTRLLVLIRVVLTAPRKGQWHSVASLKNVDGATAKLFLPSVLQKYLDVLRTTPALLDGDGKLPSILEEERVITYASPWIATDGHGRPLTAIDGH